MSPDLCPAATATFFNKTANRLVDAGFAAVPRLIQALEDRRFTHADNNQVDILPPQPFRVRDAAVQILERISKQRFGVNYGTMSDEQAAKAKQAALAWWRQVSVGRLSPRAL